MTMKSNTQMADGRFKIGGILFDAISGKDISRGLHLSREHISDNLKQSGAKGTWSILVPGRCLLEWDCEREDKATLYDFPANTRWNTRYSMTSDKGFIAIFAPKVWLPRQSEDEISIHDLKTGRELSHLPVSQLRHFDKMFSTSFILSNDAKWIIVKNGKNKITKYCANTWNIQMEYAVDDGHTDVRVTHVNVCDLESKLLARTSFGVKLWNLSSGKLLGDCCFDDQVIASYFSYPIVILGFKKGDIEILDMITNDRFSTSLPLDDSNANQAAAITILEFHAPYLYVGSSNGHLYVLDTEDSKRQLTLSLGAQEPVHSILLSGDGLRLIVNHVWIFRLFWDYEFPG